MRLLLVDENGTDLLRLSRVTGLGRGVDSSGLLSADAVDRTIVVLEEFAHLCGDARRRAVATSATRDAANRDAFLDRAEETLGVRPDLISGLEEAELAYSGATAGRASDCIVVDIGGGSTEFAYRSVHVRAVSIDIGSVRLTDRLLPDRPADYESLETAVQHVEGLFAGVFVPVGLEVVGVAGTWTSLAAVAAGASGSVHGMTVDRLTADRLVVRLAGLSLAEAEHLPGLDPARAPVILGGAVIAREVMRRLGAEQVTVSERDLLDGIVAGL